jgi:hypothetical protein
MIEIDDIKIPSHVSYSAITTWLKCGWQYYLGRLKGVEEEPSVWLVGGSSYHRATEEWDRGHEDGRW